MDILEKITGTLVQITTMNTGREVKSEVLVVDPEKLASYLQEEREARESLEKRVEALDGILKITIDKSETAVRAWLKGKSTPSIDRICGNCGGKVDWYLSPDCGKCNPTIDKKR